MTGKKARSKTGRRRITFTLSAPDAQKVALVGDFNGWSEKKHPMKPSGDGVWTKTVVLLPGTYEYRFYVDDSWEGDPLNPNTCRNCFGSENNIVYVK